MLIIVFNIQLFFPFLVVYITDNLTAIKFLLRDFVRDAIENSKHVGFLVFDTRENKLLFMNCCFYVFICLIIYF